MSVTRFERESLAPAASANQLTIASAVSPCHSDPRVVLAEENLSPDALTAGSNDEVNQSAKLVICSGFPSTFVSIGIVYSFPHIKAWAPSLTCWSVAEKLSMVARNLLEKPSIPLLNSSVYPVTSKSAHTIASDTSPASTSAGPLPRHALIKSWAIVRPEIADSAVALSIFTVPLIAGPPEF